MSNGKTDTIGDKVLELHAFLPNPQMVFWAKHFASIIPRHKLVCRVQKQSLLETFRSKGFLCTPSVLTVLVLLHVGWIYTCTCRHSLATFLFFIFATEQDPGMDMLQGKDASVLWPAKVIRIYSLIRTAQIQKLSEVWLPEHFLPWSIRAYMYFCQGPATCTCSLGHGGCTIYTPKMDGECKDSLQGLSSLPSVFQHSFTGTVHHYTQINPAENDLP